MKIAILDLLTGDVRTGRFDRLYAGFVRKQFYGVMPQAVAVWCRRRGHDVTYATYYGQCDPISLLPDDLDIVFIAAYTQACALAYAIAKILKKRKILTVLGGPHAKSFPRDAQRYYDIVITRCDESTIDDVLGGHYEPGTVADSTNQPLKIPLLAERKIDIQTASFYRGKPSPFSVISLLSSTGCPYSCNFCTDWNSLYELRPQDDLQADMEFSAKHFPKTLIGFHDPNFGVNFDKTLNAFGNIEPAKRNPILIESSLSILKPQRLARLRDLNCAYLAPGIESWNDYGMKAATGSDRKQQKFEKICDHFRLLSNYVPALGANFIMGTDSDYGAEPVDLTIAFFEKFPEIFPSLAIPIAYGGTPMREEVSAEGRLVPLPPMFYANPMMTVRAKNYDPIELMENLALVFRSVSSRKMLGRRIRAQKNYIVKIAAFLLTCDYALYTKQLDKFIEILKSDRSFFDFHNCKNHKLPSYYHAKLDFRLGKYSELIPPAEREVYYL